MGKNGQKEAKFFCQCCGAEVPRKSKFCPKCGKFFASVLCPNCGHTGKTEDFVNGCPECGYAVGKSNGSAGSGAGSDSNKKAGLTGTKNIKMKKNDLYLPLGKKKQKVAGDSSLPLWIYVFCLVVLIGLVMGLYSCL